MDAKDNGSCNPFSDQLCSLEWIACAMDAARRHNERKRGDDAAADAAEDAAPACGDTR